MDSLEIEKKHNELEEEYWENGFWKDRIQEYASKKKIYIKDHQKIIEFLDKKELPLLLRILRWVVTNIKVDEPIIHTESGFTRDTYQFSTFLEKSIEYSRNIIDENLSSSIFNGIHALDYFIGF